MKASELRIGNLMVAYDGLLCRVIRIDTEGYVTEPIKPFENIPIFQTMNVIKPRLPIPLTEEWLLKFGLNSHNLENGFYDGTCIGHYPKSDGWYFVVDSYDDGYGGLNYTTKEIKYVHELQNLYFFWNDKELELK